ncbi:MAG: ImmA/IrrE family metallo-endopeptidase [Acidiferrobacter sp.]
MTPFQFTCDWLTAGNDAPEIFHTTAMLGLRAGNVHLMQNEDVWSKTIRESVLVSAYPLAMWLASSWWRLYWEPLPAHGVRPATDWRMAHELSAANHGFVWPQVLFASDGEAMQIWSVASSSTSQQSVRYLNGLEMPTSIKLSDFERGVDDFISAVLNRLDAVGCRDTDLSRLWRLVQGDRADLPSAKHRRLEAVMGFEPDECPDALMDKALALEREMGVATLCELAPVYGKATQSPLAILEGVADSPGLSGAPTDPRPTQTAPSCLSAPWLRTVAVAKEVRQALGNPGDLIENAKLLELLGLTASAVEQWLPPAGRSAAGIAIPGTKNQYKFMPRKKHPTSRRFELARFLGDYLLPERTQGSWLASTDLATSRQKYQRAFAAELLCPIAALQEFLQDDYSESAVEDAALHFQVSPTTVNSLLANNGLVSRPWLFDDVGARLPYPLGV